MRFVLLILVSIVIRFSESSRSSSFWMNANVDGAQVNKGGATADLSSSAIVDRAMEKASSVVSTISINPTSQTQVKTNRRSRSLVRHKRPSWATIRKMRRRRQFQNRRKRRYGSSKNLRSGSHGIESNVFSLGN